MITQKEKRVVFSNNKVKADRDALKDKMTKHKNKTLASLTKSELVEALSVALKVLGEVDEGNVIKSSKE